MADTSFKLFICVDRLLLYDLNAPHNQSGNTPLAGPFIAPQDVAAIVRRDRLVLYDLDAPHNRKGTAVYRTYNDESPFNSISLDFEPYRSNVPSDDSELMFYDLEQEEEELRKQLNMKKVSLF